MAIDEGMIMLSNRFRGITAVCLAAVFAFAEACGPPATVRSDVAWLTACPETEFDEPPQELCQTSSPLRHVSLATLLEELSGVEAKTRKAAVWELGMRGDTRVIPILLEYITDTSWQRRHGAALALGNLKAANAVPTLISALDDESPEVRAAAAWALREIKDPLATRPLSVALLDDDPAVRQEAADALWWIGDWGFIRSIESLLQEENAEIPTEARELIARLKKSKQTTIARVDAMFEPVDTKLTQDQVIEYLNSGDSSEIEKALEDLEESKEQWATDVLIQLVQNPDELTSRYAIYYLGSKGEDSLVVELLSGLLKQGWNWGKRKAAAVALGRTKQKVAETILLQAWEEMPEARADIALGLGAYGGSQVVNLFIEAFPGADLDLKGSIVKAAKSIDDERLFPLLVEAARLPMIGKDAIEALGNFNDREAFAVLAELVNNHETGVDAIKALGNFDTDESVEVLARLLNDPLGDVQKEAVLALGKISETNPNATASLTDALKKSQRYVAMYAAMFLMKTDNADALEFLTNQLAYPRWAPSAIRAIAQTDSPDAVAAVLSVIDDPHLWVRFWVVVALGDMHAIQARPALINALEDDCVSVRQAAAEALAKISREH
jgi:HEAT repeat protein